MNNIKKYTPNNIMTLNAYMRKVNSPNKANITTRVRPILKTMHNRGVYHRNLHTDNIIVSVKNDKITGMWVIDFGRSRIVSPGQKNSANNGPGKNIGNIIAAKRFYNINL